MSAAQRAMVGEPPIMSEQDTNGTAETGMREFRSEVDVIVSARSKVEAEWMLSEALADMVDRNAIEIVSVAGRSGATETGRRWTRRRRQGR